MSRLLPSSAQVKIVVAVHLLLYAAMVLCVRACARAIEGGYSDLGLCDTSFIALNIRWYRVRTRHVFFRLA